MPIISFIDSAMKTSKKFLSILFAILLTGCNVEQNTGDENAFRQLNNDEIRSIQSDIDKNYNKSPFKAFSSTQENVIRNFINFRMGSDESMEAKHLFTKLEQNNLIKVSGSIIRLIFADEDEISAMGNAEKAVVFYTEHAEGRSPLTISLVCLGVVKEEEWKVENSYELFVDISKKDIFTEILRKNCLESYPKKEKINLTELVEVKEKAISNAIFEVFLNDYLIAKGGLLKEQTSDLRVPLKKGENVIKVKILTKYEDLMAEEVNKDALNIFPNFSYTLSKDGKELVNVTLNGKGETSKVFNY